LFWTRQPAGPQASDIDASVLIPLICHSFMIQFIVAMLRVTTSYRVLELELPIVWLGVISGTFALLPVFLAVSVGRYIDGGHDARAAWIGSGLITLSAFGFYVWPADPFLLLTFTLLLGVGHLYIMASHQMLCVRAGGERGRDVAFGNFTVAQALGQGLGPLLIGWIGGAASIPPTHFLFGLAAAGAVVATMVGFALRPIDVSRRPTGDVQRVGIRDLLKIRGLLAVLAASVVTITASDLMPVYLPLLGAERQIDVSQIGMMLTIRSAAAILSRLGYASLIRIVGRNRLTVLSMVLGGVGFLCLAAPLPVWGLYIASAVVGLGLGVASTLSITAVVDLVPVQARGTAMTLRITGNRLGQVLVPIGGGFIAAVTGGAGVLGLIGLCLMVSGAIVSRGRPARDP
jgi:predicted MFS family arabinose efflux permease